MDIRIQVMHAGDVCVAPALPFGGESASMLAVSGLFTRQDDRLWLPVFAYLIDHPRGFVLVDTGWGRAMSPHGTYDKSAQIAALGSRRLFRVNQGMVDRGCTVAEQLAERGLAPEDLACVLLTHLDCDHVSGLRDLKGAPRVLTSADELASVQKNARARLRYQAQWWNDCGLTAFEWNNVVPMGSEQDVETELRNDGSVTAQDKTVHGEGPFGHSFDLFGDGSIVCIAIPGHSDGLFAVKVTGEDGRFVLLCSDGAYGERSWRDMVLPGVATDRDKQRESLAWIRAQSEDPRCVEVLASHDTAVEPHYIELRGLPEPAPAPSPIVADTEDDLMPENLRGIAGKAAVATMLAATLSAAPLNHTDFPLPEAVPIVHVINLDNPTSLPDNPDDTHHDSKASVWEKILKILKYLLFALAFVVAFALAALNGCASCVGPAAAPVTQEASASSSSSSAEASSGETSSDASSSTAAEPSSESPSETASTTSSETPPEASSAAPSEAPSEAPSTSATEAVSASAHSTQLPAVEPSEAPSSETSSSAEEV